MPELPEVEQFRQILLPLASPSQAIFVKLVNENPPRKWLSPEQVRKVSSKFACSNVLRKGKLLCMVLHKVESSSVVAAKCKYLFLHMGMTGRLSAPNRRCRLENVHDSSSVFPPSHTYLLFETDNYKVAFSDPRKFGSAHLSDDLSSFESLAPDALHALHEREQTNVWAETILPKLTFQSMGIKALLLDQKRVISGVGNWVADEVLYQIAMHPDQSHLTEEQARDLCDRLYDILSTAVECLKQDREFPDTWLFGYRWTNKKAGKDAQGRPLKFITSGGRTSAIVESLQKLKTSQKKAKKLSIGASMQIENEAGSYHLKAGERKESVEPACKKSKANASRKVEASTLQSQTELAARRRSPRFRND